MQLDQYLKQHRYPVNIPNICAHLECSPSTVKRLIQKMKDLYGAPIINKRGQGYIYDQNIPFELPALRLTTQELAALLSINQLISELHSGLLNPIFEPMQKKTDQLLQATMKGAVKELNRVKIMGMCNRTCVAHSFATVADSLFARKQLQVCYHARGRDQKTQRVISPQRLIHYRDNWYLDAFCHQKNELRSFSVDRIQEATLLETPAIDVEDTTLEQKLGSTYGIFSGVADHMAVLHFNAYRAQWIADETWHPQQQDKWLDDGRYELKVPYHNPHELILDICRYGSDVEVIAPKSLRQCVAQRLRDASKQYVDDEA